MLQFILGASGTGKTTMVHNMIMERAANPQNRLMLIVPEQFTYETEKALFIKLGAVKFSQLKVTSFTRIAGEIFKLYGGIAGEYATEPSKIILMDMAIDQLRESLDVYKKAARNKTFATTVLDTVTEFKNAGVTEEALLELVPRIENPYLAQKTSEIALLYASYNGLLTSRFLDPLDDILRASKVVSTHPFFSNYTVYFDEFKGFTANENDMIKTIFQTAKSVYVSLCIDLVRANENDISVFASVKDTYNKLNRFATTIGIKRKVSIQLVEQRRFMQPELTHLEQNVLSPVISRYKGENKAISAVVCKNEYDEVDYALSSISTLVQKEGYTFSDIAIISRDIDTYMSKLQVACQKYDIAFYTDSRQSIANKPLIRFVAAVFNITLNGYKSEDILSLLKCGLTPYTIEEIAELENYTYIWGTNGIQWHDEFIAHPKGYKEEFSKHDQLVLARVNKVRDFVISRLEAFSCQVKAETGQGICVALIKLLEDFSINHHLEELIKQLTFEGKLQLAQEYTRIWEILIELIDSLALVIGDCPVKLKRFAQLFKLICESYDMGTLPQSLDCVIIGSAERIRITDKKAIFVLGVNDKVFPFTPNSGGVFTDSEREQLLELEIEIAPPIKNSILEERFVAYKTLCSPTHRLVLTARQADVSGKLLLPSNLFAEIARMFSDQAVTYSEDCDGAFYCQNKETAFSYLAKTLFEDTPLTATLKEVLSTDPLYHKKLYTLQSTANKAQFLITDKARAVELFSSYMKLSPTRIEGFYQCKFKYFCEHGLHVTPLRRAELNSLESGTIIHNVLYTISHQLDLKREFDKAKVSSLIKQELDLYIEQVMGGAQNKVKRFLYLYNQLRKTIYKVVEHLYDELSQSSFTPCDYELDLNVSGEVAPLLLQAENGVTITVSGKIDRVDSFISKSGEKFIRIIDYKSGKKLFNLNDVLHGLNLQMLIYLFCLCDTGTGVYLDSAPAGILYMPASDQSPFLPRNATLQDTNIAKSEHYKMNGLLLDNHEVLTAMEQELSGIFIPITTKVDGTYTAQSIASLVNLKQLAKLDTYIKKLITDMAQQLHAGRIEAEPIEGICSYCSYSGVCGVHSKEDEREYIKLDKENLFKEMTPKEDETNE